MQMHRTTCVNHPSICYLCEPSISLLLVWTIRLSVANRFYSAWSRDWDTFGSSRLLQQLTLLDPLCVYSPPRWEGTQNGLQYRGAKGAGFHRVLHNQWRRTEIFCEWAGQGGGVEECPNRQTLMGLCRLVRTYKESQIRVHIWWASCLANDVFTM